MANVVANMFFFSSSLFFFFFYTLLLFSDLDFTYGSEFVHETLFKHYLLSLFHIKFIILNIPINSKTTLWCRFEQHTLKWTCANAQFWFKCRLYLLNGNKSCMSWTWTKKKLQSSRFATWREGDKFPFYFVQHYKFTILERFYFLIIHSKLSQNENVKKIGFYILNQICSLVHIQTCNQKMLNLMNKLSKLNIAFYFCKIWNQSTI